MAIMKREKPGLSYDKPNYVDNKGEVINLEMAKDVIKYLLRNKGDAIVSFPGLPHEYERDGDTFPERRYKDTEWTDDKFGEVLDVFEKWNKKNLLKYASEPGWDARINDRGKGHEYDYFILSWSNNESKELLRKEQIRWKVMEAVTRVVSSSWRGFTGVKHSFIQAHEDSTNFHIHFVGHRHAVDIDKQRIGPSEIPTKGKTPTTDLANAINLEIEKELNDETLFEVIRLRDCLDENGISLFGDHIRAQSLAAQHEASEAIERAGGINTKVLGKVDYAETIQGKEQAAVLAGLLRTADEVRREIENDTAARMNLDAKIDSGANTLATLQQAIGILQAEEDRKKELAQAQAELESTKTELDSANENLLATMNRAEQLVAEQQALQEKMDSEIAKRDEFIDVLEGDISELKGDKESLTGQVKALTTEQERLNTELTAAKEEVNMAMEDVARLTDRLTTQAAAMKAMTDERDKALAEAEKLQGLNDDVTKKLDEARQQISTLANTAAEQTKQIGELTKQRDDAQSNVTRLNNSIRDIQTANERTLAQLKESHEQALASQKAELEAAQTQTIEALKAELDAEKEQALAALKTELETAHAAAMESLKADMAKAHEAALASLREEMLAAHKAEMTALRQELTATHGAEVQVMQQEMEKMREDLKMASDRHQEEMQIAATKASEAQEELTQTIAQLQEDLKSTRSTLISTREENERLTAELAEANRARGKMEGQMEVMQAQMEEQRKQVAEMMTMMRGLGAAQESSRSAAHLEAVLRQISMRPAPRHEREANPDMVGYNKDNDPIFAKIEDGRVKAFIVMSKDGQLVTADGDKLSAAELEAKAKARIQEEADKIHEIDDPESERE